MANNYFLYARKSTDTEERQVLSIEAQLAELKILAAKENIRIKEIFQESRTAKEPGRPIFNQMLDRMEKGEANGILAWHPDRLARNSVDGGRIIYLVDREHIQFLKFPTFWFENTPQGKFMLQIAFGQSKYYVDNLAENVLRGLRQKVRRGEWPCGCPPVGYLLDRNARKIVIDPVKGPLIKKLFETYATGKYTLKDMTKETFAWGLTNSAGKRLAIAVIERTLKRTVYYGLIKFREEVHPGNHEPLITKELFDKVQTTMSRRGKFYKYRKHHFPLIGLATCPTCDCSITAELQKGHHYYRCSKKKGPCNEPYVREEVLAKQISQAISNISLPQPVYDQMMEAFTKETESASRQIEIQNANLKSQLKGTEDKLARILDLHLEGIVSEDEYRAKKAQLLNQKIDLTAQLEKSARRADFWLEPAKSFLSAALRAGELAHSKNLESQKDFLKTAGSNLQISGRRLLFTLVEPWKTLSEARDLLSDSDHSHAAPRSSAEPFCKNADQLQDRPAVEERKRENVPSGT